MLLQPLLVYIKSDLSGGKTTDDCISQSNYEDKENGGTLALDATVSSQAMSRKSGLSILYSIICYFMELLSHWCSLSLSV